MGNRNDVPQDTDAFDYHNCPTPISDYDIDPFGNYSQEYFYFMAHNCKWMIYGEESREFCEDAPNMAYLMLKEQEVTEIIQKNKRERAEKLGKFGKKLDREMKIWDELYREAIEINDIADVQQRILRRSYF